MALRIAARIPEPDVTEVLVTVVVVVEKEVTGMLLFTSDPPCESSLELPAVKRGASIELIGVNATGCAWQGSLTIVAIVLNLRSTSATTQAKMPAPRGAGGKSGLRLIKAENNKLVASIEKIILKKKVATFMSLESFLSKTAKLSPVSASTAWKNKIVMHELMVNCRMKGSSIKHYV